MKCVHKLWYHWNIIDHLSVPTVNLFCLSCKFSKGTCSERYGTYVVLLPFLFMQHLKAHQSVDKMLDFNNSDTPVQSVSKRDLHFQNVCTLFINLCNAGCNEADLADQSGTANPARCINKRLVNSSSISGGVVCYNETTEGSRAVYICNNGLVLMGNEARFCQSDGNWNGSIPQCMQEEGGMCCSQFRSITAY